MDPHAAVLSIMAGVSLTDLGKVLDHKRVVRSMPNICVRIGQVRSGGSGADGVFVQAHELGCVCVCVCVCAGSFFLGCCAVHCIP